MSVYSKKRNDGTKTWYYTFNYKKRTYRGIGGTTKTQALRVQEKVRSEVIDGEYELKREIKNPKLVDFAKKFLERYSDARSYERYVIMVNQLLKKFKNKTLLSITTENIEDYKSWRKAQVSNATVNRELACLKRIYNLGIKWGDVDRNPVNKVEYLDEPEQKDRYVTRDEAIILLDVASPHLKPILETAFNTGMRLQEVLGLKWEQATLNNPPKPRLAGGKKILDYGKIELEGLQTKNKKNRVIPINQTLSKVLNGLERKNEYVFIGTRGERLKSVRKPLATAVRRAGIERATFHDFRASWASWMSQEGVDPFTIMKIGGWRDLKTVLRYVHRNTLDLQVAMSRIDGILEPEPFVESSKALEMNSG